MTNGCKTQQMTEKLLPVTRTRCLQKAQKLNISHITPFSVITSSLRYVHVKMRREYRGMEHRPDEYMIAVLSDHYGARVCRAKPKWRASLLLNHSLSLHCWCSFQRPLYKLFAILLNQYSKSANSVTKLSTRARIVGLFNFIFAFPQFLQCHAVHPRTKRSLVAPVVIPLMMIQKKKKLLRKATPTAFAASPIVHHCTTTTGLCRAIS